MIYLQVEHISDDDFDYIKFDTFSEAVEWMEETHIAGGKSVGKFVLSSEPVGLPESEYSTADNF